MSFDTESKSQYHSKFKEEMWKTLFFLCQLLICKLSSQGPATIYSCVVQNSALFGTKRKGLRFVRSFLF